MNTVAFYKAMPWFYFTCSKTSGCREVSVAETENPDRDPRTQIVRTIVYSRNVFSTVMAGAHA